MRERVCMHMAAQAGGAARGTPEAPRRRVARRLRRSAPHPAPLHSTQPLRRPVRRATCPTPSADPRAAPEHARHPHRVLVASLGDRPGVRCRGVRHEVLQFGPPGLVARPDLNGRPCAIEGYDESKARYRVRFYADERTRAPILL